MTSPAVCIAVACKGQAHFLAEAIGSLVAQTCEDWEAVVSAGDEESYGEALRLRKEDSRVWVAHGLPAARGLSAARNAALAISSSSYCMGLDADDRLDPTYLERTIQIAGPTTIATTNLQQFGDRAGWWDTHELTPLFPERIVYDNMIHVASVFPRDLWEKVGRYDEGLRCLEDWALWIAMAKAGATVAHVPERLFFHRQHVANSATGSWWKPFEEEARAKLTLRYAEYRTTDEIQRAREVLRRQPEQEPRP